MTNANTTYAEFTGSENFHEHGLTRLLYTDGICQVAEDCGAFWFIDLVMSHQFNPKVRAEEFQVWKLKRVKGDKFIAVCEDGNNNQVISQTIPYSDFTYDQLTVYFENNVLLLPSER